MVLIDPDHWSELHGLSHRCLRPSEGACSQPDWACSTLHSSRCCCKRDCLELLLLLFLKLNALLRDLFHQNLFVLLWRKRQVVLELLKLPEYNLFLRHLFERTLDVLFFELIGAHSLWSRGIKDFLNVFCDLDELACRCTLSCYGLLLGNAIGQTLCFCAGAVIRIAEDTNTLMGHLTDWGIRPPEWIWCSEPWFLYLFLKEFWYLARITSSILLLFILLGSFCFLEHLARFAALAKWLLKVKDLDV